MKFVLKPLTNCGRFSGSGSVRGAMLVKAFGLIFFSTLLVACSGYASNGSSLSASEDSAIVNAANFEIDLAAQTADKDTQCSDFVAKVLRRMGLNVPGFQANSFDQVASKYLSGWSLNEFTTEDLAGGRAQLRAFLNSVPDHTAFFAQWPRENQSGHVAVVEKIALDNYEIYQASAGTETPNKRAVKIEGLLYGTIGIQRSHIRLWTDL